MMYNGFIGQTKENEVINKDEFFNFFRFLWANRSSLPESMVKDLISIKEEFKLLSEESDVSELAKRIDALYENHGYDKVFFTETSEQENEND